MFSTLEMDLGKFHSTACRKLLNPEVLSRQKDRNSGKHIVSRSLGDSMMV